VFGCALTGKDCLFCEHHENFLGYSLKWPQLSFTGVRSMWSQQAGSKPAFRQGQGGGCSVRPGAGSSRGDFPCFLAQVVRELGSLFAPDQGCFSLDEKPQFWFDSKSMQSSMGQGTLPEKLPVLLTLRLGAFLFFGNVMSALTSADRCS